MTTPSATPKKDRPAQLAGTTGRPAHTNTYKEASMPAHVTASSIAAENLEQLLPAHRERAAAYRRAEALSAALRAMQNAPESVCILPGDLAAIEAECRVACDAADALFEHAAWCDSPDVDGGHNCMALSQYIDGVSRVPGAEPSSASAVAWANEEDGVQAICLSVQDDEGDSQDGWFSAEAARALAAQLLAAADLIDGELSGD